MRYVVYITRLTNLKAGSYVSIGVSIALEIFTGKTRQVVKTKYRKCLLLFFASLSYVAKIYNSRTI